MAYQDIEFPTNIAHKSSGGPEFSTEIIELGNRSESRNIVWRYPRERWTVNYGMLPSEDLDDLRHFFYAVRGRTHTFRFKNPDDYLAVESYIALGDGVTQSFQAQKRYQYGSLTFDRKITKSTMTGFQAYENGSPVSGIIIPTTGLIGLFTPPGLGNVITATFQFWVQMRFNADYLPFRLDDLDARSATVDLVEVDES